MPSVTNIWQHGGRSPGPDRQNCCAQALFCQVPPTHVLNMHDVTNIWQVPLLLQQQNTHRLLLDHLQLPHADRLDLHRWRTQLADRWDTLAAEVNLSHLDDQLRNS